MKLTFPGEVGAQILEIRFAFSGKVIFVSKKIGDSVKEGEILASLDKTLLQKELDKELADYEKTRAQFDDFTAKNGPSTIFQAQLDVSVKQVEIAKFHLDQINLISPVSGLVMDDGGLVSGLNVTPAGNGVKIIPQNGLYFEFEVPQDRLKFLKSANKALVTIEHSEWEAKLQPPIQGKGGKFRLRANLNHSSEILVGLKGQITLTSN